MTKKNKINQCYLCGRITKTTDDHLPPRSLSPSSDRNNFMFVPACETCNGKWSTKEELFRNFMSTTHAHKENASADDAFRRMRRGFRRNKIALYATKTINKHLGQLLDNLDGYEIKGSAFEVAPVAQKIMRGLLYFYTKEYVDLTEINIWQRQIMENEKDTAQLVRKINVHGTCGDFFEYFGIISKTKIDSIWIMYFYKQFGIVGSILQKE